MIIDHIAIWTTDLNGMKNFYVKFFGLHANEKYFNPQKNFSSYFLSYDSGAKIELMHSPDIIAINADSKTASGLTHFAISVGSKKKVNEVTERIRTSGNKVISEPRTTGDGCYESVISDPEGNRIEITE